MALLEVDNLRTCFHTREGTVRAVDGVTLTIKQGETVGLVGESGSGKSVFCYSLLGLVPSPPGRVYPGSVRFAGMELLDCNEKEIRAIRGRRIAMIFQDPMTALTPHMTVGAQLMEPLRVHRHVPRREARDRAAELLEAVGITDPIKRMREFPHQFSGGMRQRVMIAMALILEPELLIADEPTTALDVTVQAQVLDLLARLQEERGLTILLVTHDLAVVAEICHRTIVMYAGQIMEEGPTRALLNNPRHPYTAALLAALPSAHQHGEPLYCIPGTPPNLIAPIIGCPFAPRCPHADILCRGQMPGLFDLKGGRTTACIRAQGGDV